MTSNKILAEILDFYKFKIEHNACTIEEMNDAMKVFEDHMNINGTIGDFSEFYGQSTDAVKSVIKRRMVEKPKRNVVLYPFHAFRKLVPDKWRKNN